MTRTYDDAFAEVEESNNANKANIVLSLSTHPNLTLVVGAWPIVVQPEDWRPPKGDVPEDAIEAYSASWSNMDLDRIAEAVATTHVHLSVRAAYAYIRAAIRHRIIFPDGHISSVASAWITAQAKGAVSKFAGKRRRKKSEESEESEE